MRRRWQTPPPTQSTAAAVATALPPAAHHSSRRANLIGDQNACRRDLKTLLQSLPQRVDLIWQNSCRGVPNDRPCALPSPHQASSSVKASPSQDDECIRQARRKKRRSVVRVHRTHAALAVHKQCYRRPGLPRWRKCKRTRTGNQPPALAPASGNRYARYHQPIAPRVFTGPAARPSQQRHCA